MIRKINTNILLFQRKSEPRKLRSERKSAKHVKKKKTETDETEIEIEIVVIEIEIEIETETETDEIEVETGHRPTATAIETESVARVVIRIDITVETIAERSADHRPTLRPCRDAMNLLLHSRSASEIVAVRKETALKLGPKKVRAITKEQIMRESEADLGLGHGTGLDVRVEMATKIMGATRSPQNRGESWKRRQKIFLN